MINISLYGLSTIQELNNILFNSFFAHLKIKEFIDNKAESSDNFFARSWNFLSEKINFYRDFVTLRLNNTIKMHKVEK